MRASRSKIVKFGDGKPRPVRLAGTEGLIDIFQVKTDCPEKLRGDLVHILAVKERIRPTFALGNQLRHGGCFC